MRVNKYQHEESVKIPYTLRIHVESQREKLLLMSLMWNTAKALELANNSGCSHLLPDEPDFTIEEVKAVLDKIYTKL